MVKHMPFKHRYSGSSPEDPNYFLNILLFVVNYKFRKSSYSSMVERNTVNILVECSIHSKCLSLNKKIFFKS
jgi:hypothetical protein